MIIKKFSEPIRLLANSLANFHYFQFIFGERFRSVGLFFVVNFNYVKDGWQWFIQGVQWKFGIDFSWE